MTAFSNFDELEASVPLSQLRPTIAFSCCASHLPTDVDELEGDELVHTLTHALLIHAKARVVLQCWVLLIMRRRTVAKYEKDALYAHLQQAPITPQERIRYRRGAMLLCHLLVEREAAGANALLDNYLATFYFPWSTAVNTQDDGFYLQRDVMLWVRQAHDHWMQNGSKLAAAAWMAMSRTASSPSPPTAPTTPVASTTLAISIADDLRMNNTTIITSARSAFVPYLRSKSGSSSHRTTEIIPSPASITKNSLPSTSPSPASASKHKRKRSRSTSTASINAHYELVTLKHTIERWAKRLRRQLLRAAEDDDKEQLQQIAAALQAPPLTSRANPYACGELSTEESLSEVDDGESDDSDPDSANSHPASSLQELSKTSHSIEACPVCEEEPQRLVQVRNAACTHSFCNECMYTRLSQRERRCMYCRAKIRQVVDGEGRVWQHYEWTRRWQQQQQQQQAGH